MRTLYSTTAFQFNAVIGVNLHGIFLVGHERISAEAPAQDPATPLARFAEPGEVAALAVFLAGDGARFITGQCYGANGGSVIP